jgi:alkanesulfonate monooxygenase SsuD/methylene tetrahydromethanopterin reductase-like flavin-dependent oxidoreductase (luciferase family)
MFVRHRFTNGGREITDEQVDQILASPNAAAIDEIFTYAAVGTPATVAERINNFASATRVDEVITSHYADTTAARVRSLELTAAAVGLAEMSNA